MSAITWALPSSTIMRLDAEACALIVMRAPISPNSFCAYTAALIK
jgi:hypothetical protein